MIVFSGRSRMDLEEIGARAHNDDDIGRNGDSPNGLLISDGSMVRSTN